MEEGFFHAQHVDAEQKAKGREDKSAHILRAKNVSYTDNVSIYCSSDG